jgi:hypothetical protein
VEKLYQMHYIVLYGTPAVYNAPLLMAGNLQVILKAGEGGI